jgi:predicted RNase H-like HicB family nuclease
MEPRVTRFELDDPELLALVSPEMDRWLNSWSVEEQARYGGQYVLQRREGGGAMTRQFTVVVERDPESGWLVGEVTELPGCYTQARDMVELENNIREAIQVYLETTQDVQPFPQIWGSQ